MATLDVVRIKDGWRIVQGALTFDAAHPRLDRGVVRTTFTACNCEALYYRDTVNLTSARARARLIQALAPKGVTLTEEVLMALEEACRQRSTPAPAQNMSCAGDSDISEKVTQLLDLQERITSFLLLKDPDVLPVMLGAMAAHRFGGTPVWLLLVAPLSGTKTELIRALERVPGTYFLSDLTARTFASGLETHRADPSLLARLQEEVLLFKDFTTVLEMHREERQAILAQLREIYDGRFDKPWGTGKELHWKGRLGFIAGVTPIIDSHHSVLAVLGARFVMLRVEQARAARYGHKGARECRAGKHHAPHACRTGAGLHGVAPRDTASGAASAADAVSADGRLRDPLSFGRSPRWLPAGVGVCA